MEALPERSPFDEREDIGALVYCGHYAVMAVRIKEASDGLPGAVLELDGSWLGKPLRVRPARRTSFPFDRIRTDMWDLTTPLAVLRPA